MDYEIMMNGNVKIGMYATEFEAETTMGKISLNDYRGKWIVLFSHPGDFTPVCSYNLGKYKKWLILPMIFDIDKLIKFRIKMAQNRLWSDWLGRKWILKEFKGVWIPYEILTDVKLNDKEKIVYSMILYLSKEKECIISNLYISKLLNITKIQSSRIVNSLKKKGYIKVEMNYKENSKEIDLRKITPIYKNVDTYKQFDTKPINTNVKEIINNNNKYKSGRDYSNFDWTSLYANNF